MDRVTGIDWAGWLSLLTYSPLVSLVLAVIVGGVVLLVRPAHAHAAPARAGSWLLAIGAGALVLAHVAQVIASGYLLRLADVVAWWRFTTPLLAATVVLIAVLGRLVLRSEAVGAAPVQPTTHRSWRTFGPARERWVATAAVLLLVGVTVVSGRESTPDAHGRFVHLAVPIPNTDIDPVRPWFYGWAYGAPVLLALVVLLVVTAALLHLNAVRSFRDGSALSAERRERESIARGTTRITAAAVLLTLGGALRFIAQARIGAVEIEGQGTYQAVWRYAEVAAVGGWLAPAAEVVAFLALLSVIAAVRHEGRTALPVREQTA